LQPSGGFQINFTLSECHRNLSDDELLLDVTRVANSLRKQSITMEEYDKNGKYHHATLSRRFGSWKNVLQKANLNSESRNFYISNEEYINNLKEVAILLKQNTITTSDYKKYGKFNDAKLSKRFGGWAKALAAAGLEPTGYQSVVSDEDLLEDIENIWITLGRQPTTTDIKAGLSKYSLNTYARHFGSWRHSLEVFVSYINSETPSVKDFNTERIESVIEEKNVIYTHHTKRDINLKLRFLVMKRDNFKCCACGASPAKDPSVVLHVDHIVPWAKGGETEINNLQTLCSKCNLGKSDMY
jgi:hypothetical protein